MQVGHFILRKNVQYLELNSISDPNSLHRHDLLPAQRISKGITSNESRSGKCPYNLTLQINVSGHSYGPRRLDLSNRSSIRLDVRSLRLSDYPGRNVDDAGMKALLAAIASSGACLSELVLHRNFIGNLGAGMLAMHFRETPGLIDVDLGFNAIADRFPVQPCRLSASEPRS